MMKKRKKSYIIIICFLVILEFSSIFLCFKSFNNKQVTKEQIIENNNSIFAILYEEDAGEYKYDDSNINLSKSGYIYNSEKSGCLDRFDQEVEGILEYDESTGATVNTEKEVFCYLYFDKIVNCNNKKLGQCLLDNNEYIENLNDDIEGGMHRYQGNSVKDNYICFGTTDKDTCLSLEKNKYKYLYRIVGVNEDAMIKVVSVGSVFEQKQSGDYNWLYNPEHNSTDYGPNLSLLWSLLDDVTLGDTSHSYLYSGSWYDRIPVTNPKYGRVSISKSRSDNIYIWKNRELCMSQNGELCISVTAEDIYNTESNFTETNNQKISLLYLHDIIYSFLPDNSKYSWLTSTVQGGWLQSSRLSSRAWIVDSWGSEHVIDDAEVDSADVTNYNYIFPVFYLSADEISVNGTGTKDDPFILKDSLETSCPGATCVVDYDAIYSKIDKTYDYSNGNISPCSYVDENKASCMFYSGDIYGDKYTLYLTPVNGCVWTGEKAGAYQCINHEIEYSWDMNIASKEKMTINIGNVLIPKLWSNSVTSKYIEVTAKDNSGNSQNINEIIINNSANVTNGIKLKVSYDDNLCNTQDTYEFIEAVNNKNKNYDRDNANYYDIYVCNNKKAFYLTNELATYMENGTHNYPSGFDNVFISASNANYYGETYFSVSFDEERDN